MGWSCGTNAARRLNAIRGACVDQTGSSNVYEVDGIRYYFEVSRVEHHDGAITGAIYRSIDDKCFVKSGSFRIEGDGKMNRGPKFMKDVPAFVISIDDMMFDYNAQNELPTDDSLRVYIKTEYMKQYEEGGINRHIALATGIMPYPNKAHVTDLKTGEVVAKWQSAMFEVW